MSVSLLICSPAFTFCFFIIAILSGFFNSFLNANSDSFASIPVLFISVTGLSNKRASWERRALNSACLCSLFSCEFPDLDGLGI